MKEYQPKTSFSTHQRFEFLCPEHRTVEARALLEIIEGVRLIRPNPEAKVETRVHLVAGTTYGIKIRGVAKTEEVFDNVLSLLSEAEIAGYSRRTQILTEPNPHISVDLQSGEERELNTENGFLGEV